MLILQTVYLIYSLKFKVPSETKKITLVDFKIFEKINHDKIVIYTFVKNFFQE